MKEKKQYHPLVELFLANRDPHTDVLRHLKNEWRYPEEFIKEVLDYFEGSFDVSNDFLYTLDGADDLNDAWERFTEKLDLRDEPICPFDNKLLI